MDVLRRLFIGHTNKNLLPRLQKRSGIAISTTIQLVMDNSWIVAFRTHSASTEVEASLKFDIQLTGVPSPIFSNGVGW